MKKGPIVQENQNLSTGPSRLNDPIVIWSRNIRVLANVWGQVFKKKPKKLFCPQQNVD